MCNYKKIHMSEDPGANSISASQHVSNLPTRYQCSCLTALPTITGKLIQRTGVSLMAPNTILKNKLSTIFLSIKNV